MQSGKGVTKESSSRKVLERPAIEGDSPLGERRFSPWIFPSSAGHVKPGMNSGGPPPKAKYFLATDSEPVARAKNEKNPC